MDGNFIFYAVLYSASLHYTLSIAPEEMRTLIINTSSMDICLLWVLCVVEVEDSATSWSIVQRIPTDWAASLCVIQIIRERGGHGPLGSVAQNQIRTKTDTEKGKNSYKKLFQYQLFISR
jgi:hypothetical protein